MVREDGALSLQCKLKYEAKQTRSVLPLPCPGLPFISHCAVMLDHTMHPRAQPLTESHRTRLGGDNLSAFADPGPCPPRSTAVQWLGKTSKH